MIYKYQKSLLTKKTPYLALFEKKYAYKSTTYFLWFSQKIVYKYRKILLIVSIYEKQANQEPIYQAGCSNTPFSQ